MAAGQNNGLSAAANKRGISRLVWPVTQSPHKWITTAAQMVGKKHLLIGTTLRAGESLPRKRNERDAAAAQLPQGRNDTQKSTWQCHLAPLQRDAHHFYFTRPCVSIEFMYVYEKTSWSVLCTEWDQCLASAIARYFRLENALIWPTSPKIQRHATVVGEREWGKQPLLAAATHAHFGPFVSSRSIKYWQAPPRSLCVLPAMSMVVVYAKGISLILRTHLGLESLPHCVLAQSTHFPPKSVSHFVIICIVNYKRIKPFSCRKWLDLLII